MIHFRITLITSVLWIGSLHADDTVLAFKISDFGRTFEGLGAVSAGASSRLLIDDHPKEQ